MPARLTPMPYLGGIVTNSALQDAAIPVLSRLAEHMSDVPVAMFLCDVTGNILIRKVNEPRQRTQLDKVSAAEGFDFSERAIGTNGLGTVLVERRPLLVQGNEHFNEMLAPLTCSGTPVFEPFTGRLLGVFSLASKTEDANPLMHAITVDVGRQIESNLNAMLDGHERALIQSYVHADRTKRDPVIVVNQRTVFANTAGLSYLNPESHALLWIYLNELFPTSGVHRTRVPLSSGWRDAEIEAVKGAPETGSAYTIRILPEKNSSTRPVRQRSKAPSFRVSPTNPHSSRPVHPVPEIEEQLSQVARHRERLVVVGGTCTGKLHTALAFLRTNFGQCDPLLLDVAMWMPGDAQARLATAMDALNTGRAVVLQHLQDLEPAHVNRIKALARRSCTSVPIVATVDIEDAPEHVSALVSQLGTAVRLPALREIAEHIPAFTGIILAGMSGPERTTRFSSEAQQLLIRAPWPGNLAELRRTVELLARRIPGRIVQPADLPANIRQSGSRQRWTMIESVEREAILRALEQYAGNRSKAAEALGIGRTTLYRKIRALRIDA
ncbi:sigma-54-dependent Fis family transcriptional regulator [Rhodococcus sp. MSC1_016]|uniref:sigma-54-dependent Fis family transcriptional regulator n=1 Tax=Rhodococcus sp. MSC1_016 TaxID=2909266 RepID=UPI00202E0E59|nr:helix-turn-helix domain-containing protein [Rhodococcus sp. MSC1_016]